MSGILQAGRNCWRIARAGRFSLLVDAESYYTTLAQAVRRAERSIALLAWDLDTRTPLVEHDPAHRTGSLQEFFRELVLRRPELEIRILAWDFPMIFANVRDPKLVRREDPFKHERIHLQFDSIHPAGASHHQKIVCIDGKVCLSGGMDLAGGRWDTSDHHPNDPRREYPPSHDVQAMVDGDAAGALAEIVRDRWHRATGEFPVETASSGDPWPEDAAPDLIDVDVAISRTDPMLACREVERLHLDLIAAARECLYLENQYLTSSLIVGALSRRLQEPDGPEVVIVLPLNNHGWVENHTLEVLRYRRVRALRAADRFGRLRICYPTVHEDQDESIVVHSKITAVDDRLLRVGSSNLTARSMALDTECDLTIEAADDRQRRDIGRLRNRLLGEHLGLSPEEVAERLAKDCSVIELIDSCSSQRRCLRELPDEGGATQILSDALIDPSQPLTPGFVLRTLGESAARNKWFWLAAGAAAGIGLRRLTANRSPRSR